MTSVEGVGISQQAYEIYSQFEGQLPWFCTSCLASLKSLHSSLDQLTLENHALKLELTQLRSLDGLVANLFHEVSRLSRDLAFITKPDLASVSMNPACNPRHAIYLNQSHPTQTASNACLIEILIYQLFMEKETPTLILTQPHKLQRPNPGKQQKSHNHKLHQIETHLSGQFPATLAFRR